MDRQASGLLSALMSKCYPSNHNRRERIFPLHRIVGHAGGDRRRFLSFHFHIERGKKIFMKKEVKATHLNKKNDLNSFVAGKIIPVEAFFSHPLTKHSKDDSS